MLELLLQQNLSVQTADCIAVVNAVNGIHCDDATNETLVRILASEDPDVSTSECSGSEMAPAYNKPQNIFIAHVLHHF